MMDYRMVEGVEESDLGQGAHQQQEQEDRGLQRPVDARPSSRTSR